jgi:DNA polymerase III epsilon subunit-like protein
MEREPDATIVVVDTETSDWDRDAGIRVLQAAAILIEPPYSTLGETILDSHFVPPGLDLDSIRPDVIGVNRLTPEFISRVGVDPVAPLTELSSLLAADGVVVAAHNWEFDRIAIESELRANGVEVDLSGVPYIDTLKVARQLYDEGWDGYGGKKLPDMKLGTCFYGIVPRASWSVASGAAHDARHDAIMCGMLVSRFLEASRPEDLVALSRETFVPRTCPMGSERGKKWADVDFGFLRWMVKNAVWKDDVGLEIAVLEEAERRGII